MRPGLPFSFLTEDFHVTLGKAPNYTHSYHSNNYCLLFCLLQPYTCREGVCVCCQVQQIPSFTSKPQHHIAVVSNSHLRVCFWPAKDNYWNKCQINFFLFFVALFIFLLSFCMRKKKTYSLSPKQKSNPQNPNCSWENFSYSIQQLISALESTSYVDSSRSCLSCGCHGHFQAQHHSTVGSRTRFIALHTPFHVRWFPSLTCHSAWASCIYFIVESTI